MTIVVPVDRSATIIQTIEEGQRLAEAFDDELHIVHVLSEQDYYELDRTSTEKRHETVQMAEIEETATDIACEAMEQTVSDATPIGLVGQPADKIVRYSQDQNARYIVVGSRKRSPVGKAVFGSVTQSVLLNADQPVVAVRNE